MQIESVFSCEIYSAISNNSQVVEEMCHCGIFSWYDVFLSIVCPSDHVKVDVFIDFLNAHAGRWRHKPAVRFILAASQCLPKLSPKMLCLPITHKK